MCRNQNDIDTRIHRKCMFAGTDEEKMEKLGGDLLGLFRDVCRTSTVRANDMVSELCSYDCPEEPYDYRKMEEALTRLEFFTSESRRDCYDNEIRLILQTGQMIRIMEALKYNVYNFSKYGPEFVSILTTCYMNTFNYTNEEASEYLNMGVSTLYKKKRRAVILFGLAFLEYKAGFMNVIETGFNYNDPQISMAI